MAAGTKLLLVQLINHTTMFLLLEQMNGKMASKFWLNVTMLLVMMTLALLVVQLS